MRTKPTGNEIKKEIRTKLPHLGLKHRDISARYDSFSMGSSYDVEIKKFVPLEEIKQIVEQYKSVRRCDYSGEILTGGNTYTSIDYITNIEVPAEVMEEAEALLSRFSHESWKEGPYSSRSYHFKNTMKEHMKTLEGWSDDSIDYAMGAISDSSEAIRHFINTGEVPAQESETNDYADCLEHFLGL